MAIALYHSGVISVALTGLLALCRFLSTELKHLPVSEMWAPGLCFVMLIHVSLTTGLQDVVVSLWM